ncbi:hypothetical protein M409DRAFT_17197 [Zasmidium cellare ATCC 36951]|uniref:Uncharacterized protein n=1 Tax=Zasmidium cellare ATCC 36951 TaxID=1080233 RepID=A0A6A6D1F4_ZASCE|nr:uncharacterized protein M409DRAFT_17197 [Zasmidium cellare ATCC 36951]KAF2173254.1 hypothetical protein M409DRAFT_17197 [Zasmidium cellare ATCC 36951]
MKTVSSIAAAGSVTALSAVGLVVARREDQHHLPSNRPGTTPGGDMTAVASYPLSTPLDFPYAYDRPPTRRLASEGNNGPTYLGSQKADKKRRISLTARASYSAGMDRGDRGMRPEEEQRGGRLISSALRRLSSSRSRTPTSRPSSAAYTNGSIPISQSGSTTPMFLSNTPSPLPPNKLVKRSASLHSTNGSSPQQGSGSRLPIPTFRRPATSHQRSATLQDRLSSSDRSGRVSMDGGSREARDSSWRHYFTPRVSLGELSSARSSRRSSTSIPNPIKRVYPDRKYTPTLISARELLVKPGSSVEVDDVWSDDEQQDHAPAASFHMPPSTASSPFPPHAPHFEEATAPRRSFSIGDLLSTGPQATWRRPSTSRGKLTKAQRKGRPPVASEPGHLPMGHAFSTAAAESERPAKRRDLTDPRESQRSIYSSASSNIAPQNDPRQEIDVNLGGESPFMQFTPDHSLFVEPTNAHATTSPTEHSRLPSAALSSSSSRPARLSEITSTIGSDSEYRSVGDNSTDYQSDAAFDSIQTRTTRSSSGRRGPHIETIFDDSPPAFSSGKSTRLRDFLSDGQVGGEYNGRFRHSTIEEEDSVLSTPVRSLHNKSVTSTPSARPGAPHIFSSSPPTMNIMPDPDEIDWDAADDEKSERGLGIDQLSGTPTLNGSTTDRSLPFRFGPTLRPSNSRSANSTPQRNGASPIDRANLFDWAEQQPSPSHPSNSPPRPRTVHGKKDQDSRGSRPAGRRPASGMHARSHSVPVVPDLDGKRNSVVANKFGTWGVGSKAVTEDWNEDFEFDEIRVPDHGPVVLDEKRIDSGHEMFVPRSIREQQENVVANIGLLREWGLLIEELKELRVRASALDMLHGAYAKSWQEVDAMIELADQESEEQTLEPRRSPPSSPGFDYSAFEDTPNRPKQVPLKTYTLDTDTNHVSPPSTPQSTPFRTRPRKDSELVAQNVIAALQSRRSISDPADANGAAAKKVPFDTATLRHIVPYVHGLKRKVKEALRETEGLYSSPRRRRSHSSEISLKRQEDGNSLRDIFDDPSNNHSTKQRPSRRERAATDNDGGDDQSRLSGQSATLAKRMQRISILP